MPLHDRDASRLPDSWRPVALAAALILLATAAYFVMAAWQSHRSITSRTSRDLTNLAHLLAERTVIELGGLDQSLVRAAGGLAPLLTSNTVDVERLRHLLGQFRGAMPAIKDLAVYDRGGALIASLAGAAPGAMAAPDLFTLPVLPEEAVEIKAQVLWDAAGAPPRLMLTMPIAGRRLQPLGLVAVLVDRDRFNALYGTIELGGQGLVALSRSDGLVLARMPRTEEGLGEFLPSLTQRASVSRVILERDLMDGVERMVRRRYIPEIDAYMVVGIATESMLREWRHTVGAGAAVLLGIIAVVLLPLFLLARQRKEAEVAADASDRRFLALADSLPGMVFSMTIDGKGKLRFSYVSKGIEDIFGFKPRAVTNDSGLLLRALEPGDRERFLREVEFSVRSLEPWTMEFRVRSKDGTEKWVQGISHPSRHLDGRVVWNGFVLDITNRKQIDATLDAVRSELQEKNRQFDVALNNMIQGLTLYDADERLIVFNQRYAELYNFPAGGLKSLMTLEEIMRLSVSIGNYAPEEQARIVAERLAIERAREPRRFYQTQRSGRIVEVDFRPLPNGGSVATFTDVTEAKRREEEIAAKSTLLQVTLERINEGISVFDGEGRLRAWNDQFLRMLDLPERFAVQGASLSEISNWQQQQGEIGEDFMRILKDQGSSKPSVTWEHVRPNGAILELQRNLMPDGGFVTVYRDVTEIKRAAAALKNAKDQAEQADRAKSMFLANMSHELRTPLNAIIGFSEILRDQLFGALGSERYQEYANDIHVSGEHLLSLINDVLDMSKIEAGRVELHQEEIDLVELIESSANMVQPRAEEGRVTLEIKANGLRPILLADERSVKQILLNLLSNAVKFTPVGGNVTVSLATNPSGLEVLVRDTGIGIAPDALNWVMLPFAQAESTISRKYGGTGLGLSISKALVELHGGSLEIKSAVGEGTRVKVVMPAARISEWRRQELRASGS